MSFFGFRKNGKSRGRIRDRFLGRISENPSKDDQSTPPITPPSTPPLQRKFISPEDFVRFDGRLKGLIVDEKGLDVIYWRRLLDLEQETLSGRKSDFRVNRDEIKEEEEDDDDDGEEIDEIYRRRSGGSPRSDQIGEIPSRPGNAERRQETRGFDSKESFNFFPSSSRNFSPFDENPERQSSIPPRPIEPLPQTSQPPIRPLPQTTQPIEPLQSPIGPPQPPIPAKQGPNPPPPPPPGKKSAGPPPPPSSSKAGPPSKPPIRDSENAEEGSSSGGNQMKLKPLHWDKVNPDMEHSMVWHQMDRGSFNFNGDLMEALFGYVATPKKPTEANKQNAVATSSAQTYILDPRKSQNTAIVLKSLNMTKEEIIDVLSEGQDVDSETLERLSRIAPTREEQAEIFEFTGDATKLADAESFLFHILRAVPSAFTRLNVMLFKLNFNPEIVQHEESLETLEKACKELRSQGLFLKLLEAVLKAGNRMNAGTARGNAQAFNLSALRKLSDVKSIDGKTTLLHFVVEEVVRSEGKRQALSKNAVKDENSNASREEQEKEFVKLGLPVIRGLSAEFSNVKKAAAIDYEAFSGLVSGLTARAKDTLRILDQSGEEVQDGFRRKMKGFLESAEEELQKVRDEEIIVMEFVRRTTEYYQSGAMNDKNQFQLFVIIKDFLSMVDKVCGEIAKNEQKKKETAAVTAASSSGTSSVAPRYAVRFPILPPNFMSENSRDSSSESDSDS